MKGIGEISLVIGDQKYQLDPDGELAMSEETINDDLKNQPALFAFYAVMTERAEAEVAALKVQLEVLEASLDESIRVAAAASGTKITETAISQRIRLEDSYSAMVSEIQRAKSQAGILRGIKDGFSHRKDMLVTLAANMRVQSDPEIFLKKREYEGGKS